MLPIYFSNPFEKYQIMELNFSLHYSCQDDTWSPPHHLSEWLKTWLRIYKWLSSVGCYFLPNWLLVWLIIQLCLKTFKHPWQQLEGDLIIHTLPIKTLTKRKWSYLISLPIHTPIFAITIILAYKIQEWDALITISLSYYSLLKISNFPNYKDISICQIPKSLL